MPTRIARVLIVDDSALMRQMLTSILSSDPGIEVVGTAPDPLVAREKIKALNPDVLTLDVEMPRMDGLAFLEKLMTLRPMPVVMVSSLTEKGAEVTMRAMELGAVDVFCKPVDIAGGGLQAQAQILIDKVKAAAFARVRSLSDRPVQQPARLAVTTLYKSTDRLVAIGSSTGGVEALRDIILALPADSPHRHHPAHSAEILGQLRRAARQSGRRPGQGGQRRRTHHGRPCLYRAGRPPSGGAPLGRPIDRPML